MAKSLTKEENILLTLINAFQNDEKEKLNSLGNISKSLIEVRKKVKEEMEKLPPQFNVFNSINLLNHENYNSNLFANFLEIKFKYNGNEISFAKLFLKYLTEEFGWEFDLDNIKIEDIKIKRELSTEERKRIDIFIGYKGKFAVIIENKIWAEDGYKQLENYYNHVKNNYIKKENYDKIYMIYLTPYEREPSENSLNKELYKKEGSELYGKFKNIKHKEIGKWINDSILENEEFSFLHNEDKENNKNDYKILKSALIQIIDNEKSISGENKEIDDMTKDEIKEFLNVNLFNDIKTVEKAQEYIDMFNKANELLEEHKKLIVKNRILQYLDFTRKIYNNLVNKDVYWLLPDTEIIDNILGGGLSGGYSHNLEFEKKGVYLMIEIATDDLGGKYYFGIHSWEVKLQNKLREKTNEIKKIFKRFCIDYNFRDCEGAWVYYYHIDINNDKPEDIADAINKIYEFLKIEII